jgi:hypothetical protein
MVDHGWGLLDADKLCAAAHPGSVLCSYDELIESIRQGLVGLKDAYIADNYASCGEVSYWFADTEGVDELHDWAPLACCK